jgi:pyruvate-ferredoxin/flavodoxin oxidoreductase
MSNVQTTTMDGNEAVAHVAYALNEAIAIYPITPSSPMGEWADQWASEQRPNLWGTVPLVVEMQSEGGASAAVHGALQAGSLSTTFTAAQGLLLMIPSMYKIAGELTPLVIHVAARTLATHALSIFGDHSDVMSTRATGFGMLASGSVQEAADMALIAQAATLESRVPFVHFFDGFRTSHEVASITLPTAEEMRVVIDDNLIRAHRARAMTPDHPVLRGTAQNPDVFFQAREACNPFYLACPTIVKNVMKRVAQATGRSYHLYDYIGAPDAERVVVLMGSGAEVAHEAVEYLVDQGEKVGLLKVRLFRPFDVEAFLAALPSTVRGLAVLDRTKEPGATGEPLYMDVVTAYHEAGIAHPPRIIGGRYGLSSKEFTPAMVKAVLDELSKPAPKNHFTVGIVDDVSRTSLDSDPSFSTEARETVRAIFYGLGSDGTVSANKNSIKIIGEETNNQAQGYFVYDSKKAGSVTVSHLRFGPKAIRSSYLINRATFVACHQFSFLDRIDVLKVADPGAAFLLNSPFGPDEIWDHLPRSVQQQIISKKLRFHVIDAYKLAKELGMGARINTIMQPCFFLLSKVLPQDEAIAAIKKSIVKTWGKRGEAVVAKNCAAVDESLNALFEVKVPSQVTSTFDLRPAVPAEAPEFIQKVTSLILIGEGDSLPVSSMPVDGTFPTGTTQWEKRNIATEIPVWDDKVCIQCGKCVMVCPHAVIRSKVYDPAALAGAPPTFKSTAARWPELKTRLYTLQVAPEDCTGCRLCVEVCPAKNKAQTRLKAINMAPLEPLRDQERTNWNFFLQLPDMPREALRHDTVKDVQLLVPLFEFSGACAGCGETPYVKLVTQLFGDRMLIGNATGCSSIYGGNLPTTPYCVNRAGRGPTWCNSLFEDNAEFGMGMRLALDKQIEYALDLVGRLRDILGADLAQALKEADQSSEPGIEQQRTRIVQVKERLRGVDSPEARDLLALADVLVRKSVWIVGGDGWAYDIGYGGLDHVLATGRNVNILVLDTEVYSNTGGQMSKSTPRGAVAKFAAGGKQAPKKDLALMAMSYGNVYVTRIALGANDAHALKAIREAEAYPGPSLIIAYSHCVAHGYDMAHGLDQQKAAVQSGYWTLMRYNPLLLAQGKNPLTIDSAAATIPLKKYVYNETRYTMLVQSDPEAAARLLDEAQQDIQRQRKLYEHLAALSAAPVVEVSE